MKAEVQSYHLWVLANYGQFIAFHRDDKYFGLQHLQFESIESLLNIPTNI